jgi:hypothetical protein
MAMASKKISTNRYLLTGKTPALPWGIVCNAAAIIFFFIVFSSFSGGRSPSYSIQNPQSAILISPPFLFFLSLTHLSFSVMLL